MTDKKSKTTIIETPSGFRRDDRSERWPIRGQKFRMPTTDKYPEVELHVKEVIATDARTPIRGTITYRPDEPKHAQHYKRPYTCTSEVWQSTWKQFAWDPTRRKVVATNSDTEAEQGYPKPTKR